MQCASFPWNVRLLLSGLCPNSELCRTSFWVANNDISGTLSMQQDVGLLLSWFVFNNSKLSGTLPKQLEANTNDTASFYSGMLSWAMSSYEEPVSELCERTLPRGSATGAVALRFGSTQISGTIPSKLLNPGMLVQLDIDQTGRISGTIPANSGAIVALSLNGNRLSGTISNACFVGNRAQSGVEHVTTEMMTWWNNLMESHGGKMTVSWQTNEELLTSILTTSFTCERNHLSGTLPSFGNDTLLLQFSASGNSISGVLPTPNLHWCYLFDVGANVISGSISRGMSGWTKLEFLMLGTNQISGQLSPLLGSLTSLSVIDLETNYLSGSNPSSFQEWTQMVLLSVSGNSNLEWNLTQLAAWPKLQHALMANCAITGVLPAALPH